MGGDSGLDGDDGFVFWRVGSLWTEGAIIADLLVPP